MGKVILVRIWSGTGRSDKLTAPKLRTQSISEFIGGPISFVTQVMEAIPKRYQETPGITEIYTVRLCGQMLVEVVFGYVASSGAP
ncbi:hypothetical protein DL765_001662 [Monosporascus sp. GIB2]|nr:hypothetical protein DL765_001662 [Monosporascus sp. GIB2]